MFIGSESFFHFFVCVRSGWWKLVYFVPNMFCLKSFPSSWKSKWNVWLFHYCVDVVAVVFFWFHLNCPCYNLLWVERTDQTSEFIGSRHVLILLWSLLIIRNWGKNWLNKKKKKTGNNEETMLSWDLNLKLIYQNLAAFIFYF